MEKIDKIEQERADAATSLLVQLERLQNATERDLDREISRAKNMSNVVSSIIKSHKVSRDYDVAIKRINLDSEIAKKEMPKNE